MTTPTLPTSYLFAVVRGLLRYAVPCFTATGLVFGYSSENAYDEAVYLILHTLHLPIDTLGPFLDARLLPKEVAAVLKMIERYAVDCVLAAYITHEAFMYGIRLCVGERVTVPCSFVDELLEDGLESWIDQEDDLTDVLELCTGSDCLPILAVLQQPNSAIDAVDLSSGALVVTNHDIDEYHLQDCICLYEDDLYTPLLPGVYYDVILADPPYADKAPMRVLSPECRVESRMALAGGNDDMDIVHRILADAPRHLKPHGMLMVEIGSERGNVEAAFLDLDLVWLPTSAGEDQVFLATHEAF